MYGKGIAAKMPAPAEADVGDESASEDAAEGGEDEEMKASEESAASELKDAMDGGSPADIVAAFKKMSDICSGY